MPDSLSERTQINLTISSWWHVAIIVVAIVSCYFGLKADTDAALAMSRQTASDERATQEKVNAMQSDIRSVADDVKWFRQQYERDMNRFIREKPEGH